MHSLVLFICNLLDCAALCYAVQRCPMLCCTTLCCIDRADDLLNWSAHSVRLLCADGCYAVLYYDDLRCAVLC